MTTPILVEVVIPRPDGGADQYLYIDPADISAIEDAGTEGNCFIRYKNGREISLATSAKRIVEALRGYLAVLPGGKVSHK